MGKINELEWFEEDADQGDQRGMSLNFKKGLITSSNGMVQPLEENKKEVLWVIDNNITEKTARVVKSQAKIDITEVIKVPIKNGYKLLEPLGEEQKIKFIKRVETLTNELKQLYILKETYEE
jgi:hypothetical protein